MKNNKLLKALSIVSVSVLSLGMFAGCGTSNSTSEATSNEVDTNQEEVKDNNTNVKDDNVIIMGTNAEFEPFEYREDGMDIVGFPCRRRRCRARASSRPRRILWP